jgi:hypothetical protein
MVLSVYGSTGFVGSNFIKMYDGYTKTQQRDSRKPETKNILYFISTVDNYNVPSCVTIIV